MPTLSPNELKLYFTGQKKHKCYKDTVDLYEDLKTHAEGIMPTKLIEERRPSESEEVLEYRKKIYVAKTKNPISKVMSSLSKIRRSADWSVKYNLKSFPASIVEQERPDHYTEKNYPGHDSITNWVFSHLLKNYSVDANSVVMVLPNNIGAEKTNDYYKPVATLFNSDQVIFFEDGADYAILKSSDKSDLIKDDGTTDYQTGNVFHYITTNDYSKYEQTKEGSFYRSEYLVHGKGKLPVFKIKSAFLKQKDNTTIQESRLSPMLPSLIEAAREYSDLQAAKVQHMFPLFWYYQSKDCNACNGLGKKTMLEGEPVECTSCAGSGKVKFSPYAHLEVNPAKLGEQGTPVPPAGYVLRDVEIIKHQDLSVDKHLYASLASVNMQFLDQTPLNISGEAKAVDREELNNFVYAVAEDLVYTMDKIYWWVIEWRYSVVLPDLNAREEMLPEISVPENFDLLPADYLMDEITKAKTAKVNPVLVAAMEQSYATKKFYAAPEVSQLIDCYYQLDPLPGYSTDEKMSLLQNKGCTQEDYVISCYITAFVKRAFAMVKDFMSLDLDKKMAEIKKYAGEKIKVNDAAEQVKQDLLKEQQEAMQQQQQQPTQ
jgi:hypothetical protein